MKEHRLISIYFKIELRREEGKQKQKRIKWRHANHKKLKQQKN